MITGHFPKEEKASGKIWDVIERCISLDADKRYSAVELAEALERLQQCRGDYSGVVELTAVTESL